MRNLHRAFPAVTCDLMSPDSDMHWFAIQCRSGAEAQVEFNLRTMLIETLLPLARRPIRHARRIARMVVRPLFTGYLFARFSVADSLRAVAFSRGVLRVLGTRGQPTPVEDGIIASIRERVGSDGCVELSAAPLVAGDPVRITSGPLSGWRGVFERQLSDERWIEILIETLQHGRVVLWRDSVERAHAA